jgi:N-formylglutamate amidohydrolase
MSVLPAALQVGPGPVIASAIHDGPAVRDDVQASMALGVAERRREEDPFTGVWTTVVPTTIVGLRSRFEVDLNRPRDGAVYLTPEQAWGLHVWKHPPPPADLVARSLAEYEAFYDDVARVLDEKVRQHGRVVLFDLHSYNHRRDGPGAPAADPAANPEINLGTGTLPSRAPWARLIDRFIADFRSSKRPGGTSYDVRENVKFRGGQFGRWVHERYPGVGCCLSIEVKKFFMDEWTGVPDPAEIDALRRALAATLPDVLEELHRRP